MLTDGRNNMKHLKNIEAAKLTLMGAICGDIIGSAYEGRHTKQYDFPLFSRYSRFTDDTVCSVAIADALTRGKSFQGALQHWGRVYHHAGYGRMFRHWIYSDNPEPYNSYGNGSAMRVSAIGAYASSLPECLMLAKQSAEVTHNHPEGIKGAQATAAAIHLALIGKSKDEIKDWIESRFGYDLSRRYSDVQPFYKFDVSCQGSVPESIIAFLESHDYESAVRMAVAYGGDADTMAAITGGIAAAYYGYIPDYILKESMRRLPSDMKMVTEAFNNTIN